MNELLELKVHLNQISITGLKSISNDFRLKKIHEKIQLMATRSRVFSKIEKLISQLYQDYDFKIFSELINLVNAVLSVQSTSYENKFKYELDINNVSVNDNHLKFSQLNEVRKILEGSSNSTWARLSDLYKENKLNDYRVFDDFMKIINSTYTYTDYENKNDRFNIVTILSNYDERIIPILLKKFETSDNTSKSNMVKIISNIGKQKYNDYYIKWISEEENENVVANSIKALIYDKSNLDFLLSLKLTKKKLKRARVYALAYMPSVQSHEEFKNYCIKDKEFLNEFLDSIGTQEVNEQITFLSEQEVIQILNQCVETLKIELDKNNNTKAEKEFDDLYTLIRCTSYYDSDRIIDTLIEVVESKLELEDSENKSKKAVTSLLKHNTKKSYEYLVSLKDRFSDDYYHALSFIASLKLGYSKEKIFDDFSCLCKKEPYLLTYESVYHFLISILYFYEINNDINYSFRWNINEFIKLNRDNPIEWDKRWLKYTLDNDLIEVSSYFINEKTDNISEIRNYYLDYIETLKKNNIRAKYRKAPMTVPMIMLSIMLGLLKTGAKKQALENIPFITSHTYYSSYYTSDIFKVCVNYFDKQDIEWIKDLDLKKLEKEYNINVYYRVTNFLNDLIQQLNSK